MLPISLLLMFLVHVTLAAPFPTFDLQPDMCHGRPLPIPIQFRRHRGLILSPPITTTQFQAPYTDLLREMASVEWQISPFDDGYPDDGVAFEFFSYLSASITSLSPDPGVWDKSTDLGSREGRERWLDELHDSKVMIISQIEGNEVYILDAHCTGVAVVHWTDIDIGSPRVSGQVPFVASVASTQQKTDLGTATNRIRSVRKGNIDDMIDVIALAVTAERKLPSIAANDPR